MPPALRHLTFDVAETGDGVVVFEGMASTRPEQHVEAAQELRQVLDWSLAHFAHTHGPVEDGMDWNDDLQCSQDGDGWQTLSLTLTASPAFAEAFTAAFGAAIATAEDD